MPLPSQQPLKVLTHLPASLQQDEEQEEKDVILCYVACRKLNNVLKAYREQRSIIMSSLLIRSRRRR